MSFTYVTKSGRKIESKNGITTISKDQNGKMVSKTYNMGNLTAGTLVGDAGHVQIGSGTVRVQGRQGSGKLGAQPTATQGRGNASSDAMPPQPTPRPMQTQRPPVNRQVKNQFNISGSVIGQVAIGNKGPTVFNSETKKFEAGASNVDYKISGGHFAQANIGGEATYNNKNTDVSAGSGGNGTGTGGGGLTLGELASYTGAEQVVLFILRNGVSVEEFLTILKRGHSLASIQKAMSLTGNVKAMINSMMQTDAGGDSDDDN